jgi:ornithine cyclodeaminase
MAAIDHLPHSIATEPASTVDPLILGAPVVASLLAGRVGEMLDLVREALLALRAREASAPEPVFLRFPACHQNRIIAKPARLDADGGIAGVKWVSSFPGNVARGIDRCSAVLILNSIETGQPMAILDGADINFQRTAACGALAARTLERRRERGTVGFIGCGRVNFEQARYLLAVAPNEREFLVFDREPARARTFQARCEAAFTAVTVTVATDIDQILRDCDLIAFATTATEPHVRTLRACAPGTLILHTSLRDIMPEAVLASDNVVDDVDHVCTAQTSAHLAEQRAGNRRFIRATLADALAGAAPVKVDPSAVTIFNPFGLAVLDLAVGRFVLGEALRTGRGTRAFQLSA